MADKRLNCPKCEALLTLPANVAEAKVRCPACRCVFRVKIRPRQEPSLEDTVADWLHTPGEARDEPSPPADSRPAASNGAAAATKAPPVSASQAAEAGLKPPRLVTVERRGVLFEFHSDWLHQPQFRCAIPRACVHCRARTHLSAHLVIYTTQLRDSVSLEAEHAAGKLSIPQHQLASVEGTAVLELLPDVPNVPSPGNLPMPYWVCDLCRGEGWISGQIQVNTATGRGICRLRMRNLKLALGFLANAGGESGRDYRKLADFVEHTEEDPWDALPSVVHHRVEQWFRPKAGEQFLAYIPDRHFVRTEDGMNGLVVSTNRLVYHHPPRHQETPCSHELAVQVRLAEGKEVASLEAAGFKKRTITLDRGGMMLFRRALSKGKFKAKWH